MTKDLEKARNLLRQGGYTCVLCRGEKTVTHCRRGVAPLLDMLDSEESFEAFSAADKVVGKAAAMLYVRLKVAAVYAEVISEPALQVLRQHEIRTEHLRCVEAIRNRTDTGNCPMEMAVLALEDPAQAENAIREKLRQLQRS